MPRLGVVRRWAVAWLGWTIGLSLTSCAGPNLWTDLTSVSVGDSNRGRIREPARIAIKGRGWRIPARWRERGFHYGTDELVAAIQRAADRVRARDARAVLGVADLSRRTGGASQWHGSHHSGRDVDLLFYTVDAKGVPLPPPEDGMIRFDGEGKAFLRPAELEHPPSPDWAERRFDTARNWQLVEALVTDPSIRVQWIFVSDPLGHALLQHARTHDRPAWVVEYAALVMRQPGDSAPHDDHFHVRILCTRADRFHGCKDRQPVWQHEKKTYKYYGPERYDPVTWRLVLGPRPGL